MLFGGQGGRTLKHLRNKLKPDHKKHGSNKKKKKGGITEQNKPDT